MTLNYGIDTTGGGASYQQTPAGMQASPQHPRRPRNRLLKSGSAAGSSICRYGRSVLPRAVRADASRAGQI